MFTGIIQSMAQVKKSEKRRESLVLTIATPRGWKLKNGDSIATNGVCLTVVKVGKGFYKTELMPETLAKTTFGRQNPKKVNLERPLRPIDFLDGHIVQGHVDTIGTIVKFPISNFQFPNSSVCRVRFPKEYSRFVVEKGSIAIDGISLTVVEAGKDWLTVALIPYTLEHTMIGSKRVGDVVNLEFDVIAKYILKRN